MRRRGSVASRAAWNGSNTKAAGEADCVIFASASCIRQRPERRSRAPADRDYLDQVLQPAAETIRPPDDERVARAEVVKARAELGAVLERPGADILVDAFAPGPLKRVELQREVLLVGRHARVAHELAHRLCSFH